MPNPALEELARSGLDHQVIHYGRAHSVEEAAEMRGVSVAAVTKSLVIRRGEADYVLVLVPGDRSIDWPKLRAHLGVSRLSLPDAEEAKDATGYERGTITPFGATQRWPVVADAQVAGAELVSIGGGAHGVAVNLSGPDLAAYLDADVADVTKTSAAAKRLSHGGSGGPGLRSRAARAASPLLPPGSDVLSCPASGRGLNQPHPA